MNAPFPLPSIRRQPDHHFAALHDHPLHGQYNLAIEHQLQKGLDIRKSGYVGQRTIHQNNFGGLRRATGRGANTSPTLPSPPGPGVGSTPPPFQPFSTISQNFAPIYHTTGNSLQVGVHKQLQPRFMINGNTSGSGVLVVENYENRQHRRLVWQHLQHHASDPPGEYAYAFAIGRGQMLLANTNRIFDKVISGWQLAGIVPFRPVSRFP